jgi:hypothetical protein
MEAFERLRTQQPDQPLVNFLYAWCSEFPQKPNATVLESQRSALRKVLASRAADLIRWFNPTFFPALGASGLYELLAEIPEDQRSLEQWDQLAELAHSARRYDLALQAVSRAAARAGEGPTSAPRRILQIELLLRANRAVEAKSLAEPLVSERVEVTTQCEAADLFYRFHQPEIAAALYRRVLDREDLPREERVHVLAREALWLAGPPRWRRLFDAEEALPEGHPDGGLYVGTIVQEVSRSQDDPLLGQLAAESQSPNVRRKLLLRQAEITSDPQVAAQIALDLFRSRQLPRGRHLWMFDLLFKAQRNSEIISLLEPRLRKGEPIEGDLLQWLSAAYRDAGRTTDARRAESHTRDVPPPKPSWSPEF